MQQPNWYKNSVFYEIYLRSYMDGNNDGVGDFIGLTKRLGYLKRLGVDCIWLLPIYPSPRLDDGYDIADYYSIDPDYGSLNDFKKLVKEVHKRNMRVVIDLVVNHTSDQHPWFQSARSDPNSPYYNYYVWSDSDQRYQDARIIFLDSEKSNWTWDEKTQKYYWHRFYSSQPDLNYENPAVREEMLNIIRFWLDLGIDGFRVDAVPYLFQKDGTDCENLPETHEFLKKIREFVDNNFPGRILICEANQRPKDVVKYLGREDEFHMAFHFPMMPRIFQALRSCDKTHVEETIKQTPTIPASCQWGTFLRNHDELTLEMVTNEEREWLWREYAPDPKMRLNLGIRRRLAPLLDNNQGKIELAYSLLFSLPGSPFIYYGDEIGMGDNISLPDRDGVRTPMQWDTTLNAGFTKTNQNNNPVISDPEFAPAMVNVQKNINERHSLWHKVKRLIKIRKKEPALQTNEITLLNIEDKRVLAFIRTNACERLIIIHNLSNSRIDFNFDYPAAEAKTYIDLISQIEIGMTIASVKGTLEPYQSLWLKPKKRNILGYKKLSII
ncbi:MAG: trehalose synthase [Chloroflexi bacterium]|nr:MAG: trehalose synthase [Chloroflexota bacterium]MBA4375746.1 maltose alpha-D-glucosyltransferase [Anaerolinea sp.]